jgi:choline dehydrogenase
MTDYVIVGGGSAGCVLAARLTENPGIRVELLEAGGRDRSPLLRVPILYPRAFRSPFDWAFETVPQRQLGDRPLYWPRGRVLGGSSSINAMIYIRGHASDYDTWRDAGNPGWGFADVLPYFKRAEDHAQGKDDFHGTGGPLTVSALRCVNPLSQAFVDAGVSLGWPANADFNGPTQDGFGLYAVTQRGGRRCSTAVAYLRPALRRPNLTVRTEAQALRVLFAGGRAVGVEVLHGGRRQEVRASRGVVLCGGAVHSPQLLMLSGIGPADELKRHGLPVVADRPEVGTNLQDHPAIGVGFLCPRPVSLINARSWWHILHYFVRQHGPLTSNVAEAGGFVRTRPGLPTPDLQFHFLPAFVHEHGQVDPTTHGFGIAATVLRPASRGRVALASADPRASPLIDPDYLSAGDDMNLMIEGVKLARRLAHAAPLEPYRGREAAPGERAATDAAIAAHVRRRMQTLYHPAGTCRMGRDDAAVVTPELRVRGVDGLWVADASVMPTLVAGNTNAPTVMIAEKAADLIRGA